MRVVVSEFTSLDGVVQAPGGPAEDTSGGFRHGGWSMPYFDPKVMGSILNEIVERSDALLQGARTYACRNEQGPLHPQLLERRWCQSDDLCHAGCSRFDGSSSVRRMLRYSVIGARRQFPICAVNVSHL